jgi:hypothetical protein
MHIAILNRAVVEADTVLAGLKTALKRQIDEAAETVRLAYITPGDGQAMVYARKEQEARRYFDTEEVGPHIAAEAIRLGISEEDVATLFLTMAEAWATASTAIEDARLRGKAAVDAAATIEDAIAARRAVTWPA